MVISLIGAVGVTMVTGINGVPGVAMVTDHRPGRCSCGTDIAEVAMVTGPGATDFAVDLVVAAAAVVLAFPSPPEGSIVLLALRRMIAFTPSSHLGSLLKFDMILLPIHYATRGPHPG